MHNMKNEYARDDERPIRERHKREWGKDTMRQTKRGGEIGERYRGSGRGDKKKKRNGRESRGRASMRGEDHEKEDA